MSGMMRAMRNAITAGWQDPDNAVAYGEFAQTWPMYAATSGDLVARADLHDATLVVDLCSGTGATTAAILPALPAGGRVVAVDKSAAMQRQAPRSERVRQVVSAAEEFDVHVDEPVDAVVCNSAIWQTDMPATFAAARRVLRPGGRLVFNIGGQFVALPSEDLGPQEKPSLHDYMLAYAILDHDFVPAVRQRRNRTPQQIEQQLTAAGLTQRSADIVGYASTMEQTRDWLSIPIFAGAFGSLGHQQRADVLAKAYDRVDKSQSTTTRWLLVTATR
jgi:ubiquinone/menaquinone biosynthesis C-methylase UbiE